MSTWEEWESATVVAARDIQAGDTILAHPESGPFGPWEVREVRGAYMSTTRVDIISEHHTWFGAEAEQTFRVERAS
jgi:hypothetical protein